MSWKSLWKDIKHYSKKFWHFLWHEDSVWSWIVNILLAFILIKFIIYPGIGLLLGANLPVVAVISESMDHQMVKKCVQADIFNSKCLDYKYEICGNYVADKQRLDFNSYWDTCGKWYTNIGITPQEFQNYPMPNGFRRGDIIILKGVTYEDLKVGDILVYQSKLSSYPIIHRVVAKNDLIQTKGDHNKDQIFTSQLNEKYITKDQIIGKAWLKIPFLGYIKIWFTELLQCVTFNGCWVR